MRRSDYGVLKYNERKKPPDDQTDGKEASDSLLVISLTHCTESNNQYWRNQVICMNQLHVQKLKAGTPH